MKKAKVLPPLWDGAANMAEGVYTLTEAVENPIRDKRSSRDWNTPTFHKGQRFVIRPYDRLRVAYDEEEIKALPQAVQEKRYTMMLTFWPREYSGWLFANASSDDSDNYNARQTVLLLNALLPKLKLEPENLGTLIAFEEGFKGNLDSVVALLLDEGKVTLDELRKLNTRAYDLYDDDKEAERLAFERRHGI
jgi:hypothetical protein